MEPGLAFGQEVSCKVLFSGCSVCERRCLEEPIFIRVFPHFFLIDFLKSAAGTFQYERDGRLVASLESWSAVSFPSSTLCEGIHVIFLVGPCGSANMSSSRLMLSIVVPGFMVWVSDCL